MKRLSVNILVIFSLLAAMIGFSAGINRVFSFPYPSFNTFQEHNDFLLDMGGLLLGMRRIAADIAWVQLMHYYARGKMSKEEQLKIEYHKYIQEKHEHGDHSECDEGKCAHAAGGYHPDLNKDTGYGKLYDKTLRVVQLDPFFHYAYLYSSGALAWNLKRYGEAYKLLELGLKNDPSFEKFSVYISAIIYKEKGNIEEMITALEEIVSYEDTPNLVKSILANYYKKKQRYVDALKIWINVLDSGDSMYESRAVGEIAFLREKMGIPNK